MRWNEGGRKPRKFDGASTFKPATVGERRKAAMYYNPEGIKGGDWVYNEKTGEREQVARVVLGAAVFEREEGGCVAYHMLYLKKCDKPRNMRKAIR